MSNLSKILAVVLAVCFAVPTWAQSPNTVLKPKEKPTGYPSVLSDLDEMLRQSLGKAAPNVETLYGVNILVVKWQTMKFMVHTLPTGALVGNEGYGQAQEIEGPDAKGFILKAVVMPKQVAIEAKRVADTAKMPYWEIETRTTLLKNPDGPNTTLLFSLARGNYLNSDVAKPVNEAMGKIVKEYSDFTSPVCSNHTLAALELRLKALLTKEISPEELIVEELATNGFKIGYRTHKLTVHWPLKTGELQRPVEEVGPRIKGFEISVWLHERQYRSSTVIPQDLHYAYWNTFVNAYSLKDKNEYLWINLKHDKNSKMSKGIEFDDGRDKPLQVNPLLNRIEQSIADFVQGAP